ncbi:MAG: hypothetical protein R3F39_06305 [Myxococcota bacterium]
MWALAGLVGAVSACADGAGRADGGALDGAAADAPDAADAEVPGELDASEEADAISLDPCQDVACSDHGTCVVVAGRVTCECDPDFVAATGLACIDRQTVACLPSPPRDAAAVPEGVEIRYTDAAGWSDPAPCGWRCHSGFVRVEDRCVPTAALPRWCDDFCRAQAESCPGGGADPADCQAACDPSVGAGPDCATTCLAALDQPDIARRAICGGVLRRVDTLACKNVGGCETPAPAPGCEALCDAAAGCDLLAHPRMLFGASHGECVLQCQALATTLTPTGRFEPVRECAARALASCDPVYLVACTVDAFPALDAKICTTYSDDCGYIPEVWPDVGACEATAASWSGGQRLAVSGCINFLGAYSLCGEHDCANPPDVVPPAALAAATAITTACPDLFGLPLELDYAREYYGWLVAAALKAGGRSFEVDVAAVTACIQSAPCPKNGDDTLKCVLTAPEE